MSNIDKINIDNIEYSLNERCILWENTNPMNEFKEQIIDNISISEWKYIIIVGMMGAGSFLQSSIICPKEGVYQLSYNTYSSSRNSLEVYYRLIQVFENSISIKSAIRIVAINGTIEYTEPNNQLIPTIIYGIR